LERGEIFGEGFHPSPRVLPYIDVPNDIAKRGRKNKRGPKPPLLNFIFELSF
jgi:hypothetical protein